MSVGDILSEGAAGAVVAVTPGAIGSFLMSNGPGVAASFQMVYADGTWTPTIHGTSGSGQTYSKQVGRYIKIGKLVYFSFDVVLSAKGTMAGPISIGGLPYTVGTSSDVDLGGGIVMYFAALAANEIMMSCFATSTSTDLAVYGLKGVAAANPTRYQDTDLTATSRIAMSGVYQASVST